MIGRVYAAHRRAYLPRLWPLALGAGTLTFALASFVHSPVLITFLGGVAIGAGVVSLRWMVWRRRHPVISAEQYAADWREAMSRAARWN